MAPPNQGGGGGLSLQTLVIASLASATAAMLTSRLFPPGTIVTAAITPVIVAAVSEMARRPVNRVSALREQRRTMVLGAREAEAARVYGEEPSPLSGAPEWAQGAAAEEEGVVPAGNGNGHTGRGHDPLAGVRIHGTPRRRPGIHPKVAIVTGLVAFVIAGAALTLPELIFGGAVANNHRTTFFGGGAGTKPEKNDSEKEPATTEPETSTTTVPAAQEPAETDTQATPTETTTGTDTAENGGAEAPPAQTGTQTTPQGGTPTVPQP